MSTNEDLIGDAWDALHETDAMRCCCCPSCNFYLPEGEYKPETECVTVAAIKRLVEAYMRAGGHERPSTIGLLNELESASKDLESIPEWARPTLWLRPTDTPKPQTDPAVVAARPSEEGR